MDMDTLGYFLYMDEMERQQNEQNIYPFGDSNEDEENE